MEVVRDGSRAPAHIPLESIAAALAAGVILLDSDRRIVWMDKRTRSRLNGGAEEFASTLRKFDTPRAFSCSASVAEVMINGQTMTVCLIKETEDQPEKGYDFAGAVEAALADTSWFTRTIIEKLNAFGHAKRGPQRTSDLEVLTGREREVLGLICEGRSDAEMGAVLNLSQNTVRNHIASLYRKIGVNRRSAAIIWARERAITPQDTRALRRRKRAPKPSRTISY
jgi:DNA-binding CsgD family transcriptional regulator